MIDAKVGRDCGKLFQIHGLRSVAASEVDTEAATSIGRLFKIGSGIARRIEKRARARVGGLLNCRDDTGNVLHAGKVVNEHEVLRLNAVGNGENRRVLKSKVGDDRRVANQASGAGDGLKKGLARAVLACGCRASSRVEVASAVEGCATTARNSGHGNSAG